ncbi:hypothetical protein [uncultured Tateyamaria sp.]|uniref:hypothetical protein n=1 Tax=uncultured Tateyamaria sp. TaxID=455651 RepID=UPI002628E4B4|nr:hypothetical protein [uncultured Tateyamaria sp.]
MTAARASFVVVRGVVSAYKEQMHSVRVDRQTGYGRINTTPELWLRDKDGKEYRYQGVMFEAAQPGHDVAVIANRASGKPVAFANFTTGVVQDGDEMTVSTSISSTLVSTFGFSVLFALPGLIPWLLITETIGLGDKAFTTSGIQLYILVLAVSVYAGLQVWSRHYRERTATTRAEIDRMLSQLQTTES